MGIQGLTSYVADLPTGEGLVWEYYELQDTNLVIDGCGLYYHIYSSNGLNVKYGGQYKQLEIKVREFILELQKHNVKPFVIFDGIMEKDDKKFATRFKRKIESIRRMKNLWKPGKPNGNEMVLPRLAELSVIHVLQEMKVPYAMADFEADCEISSLANKLDAPVMANDSDFYIFNIKCGYIPFKQYSSSNTVKKFSVNGFAKHLGIDPSMLPLLASLTGNDYITDAMLTPFNSHIQKLLSTSKLVGSGKKCKLPAIAQFLSKYQSVSEAIQDVIELSSGSRENTLEKALHLSIEEYQAKHSNLIGYFDSGDLDCNVRTYDGNLLPDWIVTLYREGVIASEGLSCVCSRKLFLRVQCENISLPSTQTCVEDLRSWYYFQITSNCESTSMVDEVPSQCEAGATPEANIMNVQTASEIETTHDDTPSTSQIKDNNNSTTLELELEDKLNFNNDNISVTELDRQGSRLVEKKINLSQLEIEFHDIPKLTDEFKKSLLKGLFDSDLPSVNDLPLKHQLVVSALRYWVCNCKVTPVQLAALLVHYIGEKPASGVKTSFKYTTIKEVHGFSQWQNVVYWAERLNALFSSVFPQMELAKMYNGVHVCLVHTRLRVAGIKLAETIVVNANLYRLLYDVITKDQPPTSFINQQQTSRKQRKKESRQSEQDKQTQSKSSESLKGNRFALLRAADEDEDED